MKAGFVLPSCNYNIVLSKDELKSLLEKGHIMVRPLKEIPCRFKDASRRLNADTRSDLRFQTDVTMEDYSIQFLTINIEPGTDTRAEWTGDKWNYKCSNCGGYAPTDGGWKSKYCPNCGSVMSNGEKE